MSSYVPLIEELTNKLNNSELNTLSDTDCANFFLSILNELTAELLKNEFQSFHDLTAKIYFICDFYGFSDTQVSAILRLLFHCREVVKGKENLHIQTRQQYKDLLLKFILKIANPNLSFSAQSVNHSQDNAEKPKQISDLYFRVRRVEESLTNYQTPLLKLIGFDEQGQEVIVYLWDDLPKNHTLLYGKKFSFFKSFYEKNIPISIFNLRYSDEKQAWLQTKETWFLIFPDLMIDITSIAECVHTNGYFPELNYLRFFREDTYNSAIFKGNLINALLDNQLSCKQNDIDDLLANHIEANILKILCNEPLNTELIKKEIVNLHNPNMIKLSNNLKNRKITLEPTFLSVRYGMQGRLDALMENPEDPFEKDILELKSGKAPFEDAWINHKAQILCYDMLLDSVYDNNRHGYSMIFYSSSADNPFRNIPNYQSQKYNLIMVRNHIVNQLIKLAHQDYTLLWDFIYHPPQQLPDYLQKNILQVRFVFNKLQEFEKEYFLSYLSFIMREILHQKLGYAGYENHSDYGFSSLWKLSLKQKQASGQAISDLSLMSEEEQTITFKADFTIMNKSFRENDPVLVYQYSDTNTSPLHTILFKGTLISVSEREVIIRLKNSSFDILKDSEARVAIEHDFMEINHFSMIQSLYNFMSSPKEMRDLIWGIKNPLFRPAKRDFQERAVQKAFEAENYCLIQGPPGTGKTSKVIMGLVSQLLQFTSLPITIISFTNRATDEIVEKLIENGFNFIKIGPKDQDKPWHLKSLIKNKTPDEINKCLQAHRLFVSTVSSFQNEGYYLSKLIMPGVLIADEASQLLEPHLVGILNHFKKFILIGDHFQLPAVSVQQNASASPLLQKEINLHSLHNSLFERLFQISVINQRHHCIHTLTEHYRMHQDIAELINPFYNNQLKAATPRQLASMNQPAESFHQNSRCYFIPTSESSINKTNIQEIKKIIKLIDWLYPSLDGQTIGIICFWKAQCNLAEQFITQSYPELNIAVDTVERFQGSEKDIIFMSAALSSSSQISFITAENKEFHIDRKLNVAVSRAKEMFFLLGNQPLLSNSPYYKTLIEKLTLLDEINSE